MKSKFIKNSFLDFLQKILLVCVVMIFIIACSTDNTPRKDVEKQLFFDDFSYSSFEDFKGNNWKIRTKSGHPGVPGATWWEEGVSFLDDTEQEGNRFLRITSETDGTGENTRTTQICHERKYLEGTYAARVYFRDEPTNGPDGDQIVETFYTISPLRAPLDKDYSEADFEYLPNGGWGGVQYSLFATTWETFQLEPWTADNISDLVDNTSLDGWQTLIMHIGDDKVRYFVGDQMFAEHGGHVYPEVPMSINFNLWFIDTGLIESDEMRRYEEDIDWVFHQKDVLLNRQEVEAEVARMRQDDIHYENSVPASSPPLESPCGL